MGKIFFSFKKEHKIIIYMSILRIICTLPQFMKKILSDSSIIVFAGYLGNLSIIVLYILEKILSKRNKYVKHISNINGKNQKKNV